MAIAIAVAGAFAVRLMVFTIYWADPAHRNQQIEGWMTPGYVARSWDIEPEVLRAALPPPPDAWPGAHPTLAQIAEDRGIALPDLIAALQATIDAARDP